MKLKHAEEIKHYPDMMEIIWLDNKEENTENCQHGVDTLDNLGSLAGEFSRKEWRNDDKIEQYDKESQDKIFASLKMHTNVDFFRED